MCFSSSPCVPVESCCVQSVSTSPLTPLHAAHAAHLCSPCVSGRSRSRSPPAAGHLDSAGTSRYLAVRRGCCGLTRAPVYFSTRPPWRQRSTCTASAVRHVSGRRGTASSFSLRRRPPSSTNWPITTSGDGSHQNGPEGTRTGFLTQGAGLGVFQPIRDQASGYPLQLDDG